MIPTFTKLSEECDVGAVYGFLPVEQNYYKIEYLKDVQGFGFNYSDFSPLTSNYISHVSYLGAMWAYTRNSCTGNSYDYEGTQNAEMIEEMVNTQATTLKFAKGWNFLAINPLMVGKTWAGIFSQCDVISAAKWYAERQDWKYYDTDPSPREMATNLKSSVSQITDLEVGSTMIIKVANDCQPNYESTTNGPPALPGGDSSNDTSSISTSEYNSSKSAWLTNEPWGINEAKTHYPSDVPSGLTYITLTNNKDSPLTLNSVKIDTQEFPASDIEVAPSENITLTPNMDNYPCDGQYFKIPKEDIMITYGMGGISGRIQVANFDVIGTCS
jgi:hypothetical protein